MSYLGVDIGTSAVKAAVYDESGTELGHASRAYRTLHPRTGWSELDAPLVYESTIAAMREAIAQRSVHAICFAAHGEAVVPVSEDRQILGNAILGVDARGGEYARALAERRDPLELYTINPNPIGPAYTMPKLCWLRDNEPDLYRRARWFLYWADCIPYLLGCEAVTNWTHANRSLLFDIRGEEWSLELIEECGLDADKFAPIVPVGTLLGKIADDAAALLGLANRPLVVAGAHDQCLNAVGAGAVTAGSAACGIGTVECITPVYDSIPDPARMVSTGLNVEHHAVPGHYLSFIYNQAGLLVSWFARTFAADVSIDALFDELPDQPSGLLLLPLFEPTGAPNYVNDAAGLIAGLRPDTDRGTILKGIIEGITYYFAQTLELMRELGAGSAELVASGGGASSDAWLQITADILGVPIVRPRVIEAGTLGAAIIAATAVGAFSTAGQGCSAMVAPEGSFAPDRARHERYVPWIEAFRELWFASLPALERIHQLQVAGS